MAIKTSALPQYQYESSTGRYRSVASGQFVKATEVRAAVDKVIDNSKQSITNIATRLQAGEITLAEWQQQTANALKVLHVATGVAANGGFANMAPGDYGYLGNLIKDQYKFLNGFASDISTGKQLLNGQFLTRVGLYIEAARGTYEESKRREAKDNGNTEERRVLGPADHCQSCLDDAAEGWQPIGTLPRIGDSLCLTNCHCYFIYRIGE